MSPSITSAPDVAIPPTFIIGCGRSGTTLLRTMLNHHPELAIPMEMLGFVDYLRADSSVPVETLKDLLLSDIEFHEWKLPITREDLDGVQDARELFVRVHERYADDEGKPHWAHKSPRYIRYGDLIKRIFPDAKFIHVVRDPRAVTSSLIRSEVHRSNAYFGARRWLTDVSAGYALKQKYPNDVEEVVYKDLVSESETVVSRLCDFMGLTFRPEMLDYYAQRGTDEYGTYYQQIHQRLNDPPRTDRISAWRKNLSAREVQLVEHLCGDLMDVYGFERDYPSPQVSSLYVLELRLQRVWGILRQIWHRYMTRRGFLQSYAQRKWRLGLFWKDLWQINY